MAEQAELGLKNRQTAALTVTQLVRAVRETLELTMGELWVVGEVSNARIAPSSHLYFTLKDDRSSVSVVMFRSAANRLRFKVADGMQVIARGRVDLYETRGALQFYAEEMEPRGLGALQLAFEQLKERLGKEGLFDESRKRPLPFLPRTVGIVTALGSAALHDIVTVMLGRVPNLHLIIRPTKVQGDGAAARIAEAIEDLNRDGRAEVIVVGRGGGSLEDLWAFNEERVARAIFRSAIPIVSAVGHEIDYTIADFAADVRAPTPTAAAAIVVPSKSELCDRIGAYAARLRDASRARLAGQRKHLTQLAARLKDPLALVRDARQQLDEAGAAMVSALSARIAQCRRRVRELGMMVRPPATLIREYRLALSRFLLSLGQGASARRRTLEPALERASTRLEAALKRAIERRRSELASIGARLDSLSPLKVLDRGYAVVTRERDGRAVADATSVEVGDDLGIRLRRGRLRVRTVSREV